MTEWIRDYARRRLSGWTLYDPAAEFHFQRALRRYGEVRVREIVGVGR